MLKFANSAGFDILETTMVNIQDMPLEGVLDDEGRKVLFLELPKIMQQVPTLMSQRSAQLLHACIYLFGRCHMGWRLLISFFFLKNIYLAPGMSHKTLEVF